MEIKIVLSISPNEKRTMEKPFLISSTLKLISLSFYENDLLILLFHGNQLIIKIPQIIRRKLF